MTPEREPQPKLVWVEVSKKSYSPGDAVGKRVKVRLEDHDVKRPFPAKLVDYLEDRDPSKKGWYLSSLDSPVQVFSEPVTEVLLFGGGAIERPISRPPRDIEGRQISYYYEYPLEEMLLNPDSPVKYVLASIATFRDPTNLKDKRLSRSELRISPYVTIWRFSRC